MGKSRVSPLKPVTIPRLEISAALVSVKVSSMLHDELNYDNIVNVFWPDSKVVLGYICNDARRFHIFVANRVQQIRDSSSPDQWKYVESDENPADDASRGLYAQREDCRWLNGPLFLWQPKLQTTSTVQETWIPSSNDPEVKKAKSLVTQTSTTTFPSTLSRLEYFSCWYRAKRAIANCLKLKYRLKNRGLRRNTDTIMTQHNQHPNVDDLHQAETTIVKLIQGEAFHEEMKILRSSQGNTSNRQGVEDGRSSQRQVGTCTPFTYCGVDYFGPWHVKEGRKELKRYGVIFTCLASRVIHLEVAKTLETDSFINVLRRFLARRGPVRQLRSDQGTNLVGARTELKEALNKMDCDEVRQFLLKKECDWIEFKLNTPTASHAGGVWERMIRTVRNALNGLLGQHGTQLNDEALRTLMCEAEAIVNSRPIAAAGTNSPEIELLTPNHLLTMKSRVLMAPPG